MYSVTVFVIHRKLFSYTKFSSRFLEYTTETVLCIGECSNAMPWLKKVLFTTVGSFVESLCIPDLRGGI